MTRHTLITLALTVVMTSAVAWRLSERALGQTRAAAPAQTATPTDWLRWRDTMKNWGRWGPNDEKGTSNLITPQKVQEAGRLIRAGVAVSLAHAEPQKADQEVTSEQVFHRTTTLPNKDNYAVDVYSVGYHGLAVAHIDALCHFVWDGKMYNGYPVAANLTAQDGCRKDSVMAWKDGITTRAVLYDIPQLKGVPWIEPGTPVTRADLEAWERKSGIQVGAGDVIMLYTGRWKRRAARGPSGGDTVAGYYADTIPFIKERDIAFVGHDFNVDWGPRPGWDTAHGIPFNPIHQAALNWFGVGIVENLDLERLVETARRLNRYEFLLTFAPLPVEGGTGSPVNPIAIF